MLDLALAVLLLVGTPGPGVLSLAGVAAAFGFRGALPYLAGLFVGNALVLAVVASGLAALVLAHPVARTVLLALSLAYLGYLALRIAFAGTRVALIEARRSPGFGAGILLQLINPKAYAVNAVFITGFPLAATSYLTEALAKIVVVSAVWLPIHLAWALAGASLRRLDPPPRVQRAINIGMAAAMLAVVAIAALAAGA